MTEMYLYEASAKSQPHTTMDAKEISESLRAFGVVFEQWSTAAPSLENIAIDERAPRILETFKTEIGRIQQEGGYATVDVVSLSNDHPKKAALREMFIKEHTHSEDEVRFFVSGSGLFVFHFSPTVIMLKTQAGDFISVPKNTNHWFDMGSEPNFTCIRFFSNQEGWVANYTGSEISTQFPTLDAICHR